MKRRERQKKWISLMLLTVLCLVGVYGAGSVTDIPMYTSVSCAFGSDQNTVPMERFYQDSLVRLPEAEGPLERMEQNQVTVLLEQCRQVKRSVSGAVGESDAYVMDGFGQPAGSYESVDAAESASSDSRSRIIAYIHDQDGQKAYIL